MENLAYVINTKFILVAVDSNYQTELGSNSFKLKNAKKVYKLNDHNLISVIGNPYKISDVYNYILTLNELGHNKNLDDIKEDLKTIFNSSEKQDQQYINEIKVLLAKFDNRGYVDIDQLRKHIQENYPYLEPLFLVGISKETDTHPIYTQVFLFNWDPEVKHTKLSFSLSVGQTMREADIKILPENIYFKLNCSTMHPEETFKLENEIAKQLNGILIPGWETDTEKMNEIIETAKDTLRQGMNAINPYDKQPNVIFYELSSRTNFTFREPETDLIKVKFTRPE